MEPLRQICEDLIAKGDYKKAIELLLQAQSRRPLDANLMNDLGVAYAQSGAHNLALGYFRRALNLNPNDADAKTNLETVEEFKRQTEPKSETRKSNLNGKKILFVAENLTPPYGGAEKSALTLLNFLVDKGFHARGVCKWNANRKFREDGIEFQYITDINHLPDAVDFSQVDLVLTQLNWAPEVIQLSKIYGKPVFIFIRSYEHFCPTPNKMLSCGLKCDKCIDNPSVAQRIQTHIKMFQFADRIFANSHFMRGFQKRFSGRDSEVLYPFIDFQETLAPVKDPHFVGIARPTLEKGLFTFVQIAKLNPDIDFLMFGEHGTFPLDLPKNIYVWGNGEVRAPYSKLKALLVPSIWPEPFGRVVLEAMANGIPVIASKIGGLPEAGADSALYIDKFWMAEEWIYPLRKLLDNPDFYRGQQEKGYARVESFKRQNGLDNLLSTINETLQLNEKSIQIEHSNSQEKSLHIKTPYYLPLSETFIYNYLKHLKKLTPVILCHEIKNDSIFPLNSPILQYGKSIESEDFARYLIEAKAKYNLKLIHAHFGHVGAEAVNSANSAGLPLVVSFYGKDASTYLNDTKWNDKFRALFQNARILIVLSRAMLQSLLNAGCSENKIRIVHLAIDLKDYPFKERRLLPGEPVRFLSVGRLVEKKGFDDAISALAILNRKFPCELRIIGEGPEEENLRNLAKQLGVDKKVFFLGGQPVSYVREEMSVNHIFLAPSKTASDGDKEGTPTVLMEAQACGFPIVSTKHSGIPEVVEEGISGYLAEENNPQALVECMSKMLESEKHWGEMGRAGRLKVEKEFNILLETEKLEGIYLEVLESKSKRPQSSKLKIAVDCNALEEDASRVRGIGKYMFNHFKDLLEITPNWDYVFFGNFPEPLAVELLKLTQFPNVVYKNWKHFSDFEADIFYVSHPMGPYSKEVIQYTAPFKRRMVCTFHDLIPLIFPDLYLNINSDYEKLYNEQLALLKEHYQLYLCNSQCTANDLNKHLEIPQNKLKVISAGVSDYFSFRPSEKRITDFLTRFNLQASNFLLFTGIPDQRKNTVRMIMGFKSALENLKVDLKLVFVGDYPPFILEKINFIAQKVNLPRDRIITTGYLSDEELSILYHSGLALLFPSLYEGFGLPIVEAQSAGMPVITCRNSAITETAGDSALYVDEHDPNSIAQGIIEIYHNTGLRAELIRKGLENHRKFSWRKVALDTVAHLEEFCFADNGKAKLSSSGGHRPVIQDYLYNIDNHTIRPGTLLRANVLLPLLISLAEMKADLLDIGGFDGFISKTMHNLTGKRPLLLDLDFKGLQKAKLQGIPAIKGSAGKLPFDDNSFALIWALDLLEHMEHPKQALSEIARVLKPEGVFLITTPIKGRNWGLPELEMLTLHKKWGHIYPGFSETEISAMFNEARLYIEDVSGYFCEMTGTIYHHLYVSGAFPLDENSASRIWHSTVKNLEYALPSKPLEYILIGSKTSKISPAISNLIATPDFGLAQKLSTADKATDIALSDWIDDYNREFNYKRIKIPLKSQELIDKVCSCLKSKLKRA